MAGGACGWVVGRAGSWVSYLLGFWVGGSSPHVPGHPTSMCNLGVNTRLMALLLLPHGPALKTLHCSIIIMQRVR